MNISNTLKKIKEITNILKTVLKRNSLLITLSETLLLGKSQTAVEIKNLSAEFKVKEKLKKEFRDELNTFNKNYMQLKQEESNKIWVCWFMGMENAPDVVKKCYSTLQNNVNDKEIILITKENIYNYVDFPDFIKEKWESGILSHTHMSELLRLELLIKYGGLWLDATVFYSGPKIPEYIFKTDLFFYQNLNVSKIGRSTILSSWLIAAKTNNKVLLATQHLLYEYWKNNDQPIDYFIFHHIMTIVLEFYPKELYKVIPSNNIDPHILQFRLFDEYDEEIWNLIKNKTCFHKLTYKFDEEKTKTENTYYKRIISSVSE